MKPRGPKLAEGRDSEIFSHGPGRVLRRARDGRSLVREAEVMRHVRAHGYPVPEVHDAGDGFLVMDLVRGPTMLDAAVRPPFRLAHHGRVLAGLHERLHAIPAPDWLPGREVPGDRVLHGDLHPANVLMTASGPVVVDWSNARRGPAPLDVADAWVVLATADVPGSALTRAAAGAGKRLFLRGFLAGVDADAARRMVGAAVAVRLADTNTTAPERERMRRLAAAVGAPSPPGVGP